jgi:GTP-binding protein Era
VGPGWFGDGYVVDLRDEERIAEYVREATLSYLREELPHATAVTVDELFEDPDEDRLVAECTIWVERESQVGIVVGKRGEQIRDIGSAARATIQRELGTRVHLSLRVKVRKHWRDDATWLARAGL